jgi:hypothetical protein
MKHSKISTFIFELVGMIICLCCGIYYYECSPSYSYHGVIEMTQEQYASFMDEYGFQNEDQSDFVTAYNQKTDKLIVTYNFESSEKYLTKYGISKGEPVYNMSIICFIFSGIFLLMVVILIDAD